MINNQYRKSIHSIFFFIKKKLKDARLMSMISALLREYASRFCHSSSGSMHLQGRLMFFKTDVSQPETDCLLIHCT